MIPVVDDRERSEDGTWGNIWETLVTRYGWDRQRLPTGDFKLLGAGDKLILIERKTIRDFLASQTEDKFERQHKKGSRLVRQVKRMTENADISIILLELNTAGQYAYNPVTMLMDGPGEVPFSRFRNQLTTIQSMGCQVEFTLSVEDTIQRLQELRAHFMKTVHSSFERVLPDNPQVASLMRVQGVGEKTATELHEAGIRLRVEPGTRGALLSVPGVGPKTADAILAVYG